MAEGPSLGERVQRNLESDPITEADIDREIARLQRAPDLKFAIAFDPGKTTGVCRAQINKRYFEPDMSVSLTWDERHQGIYEFLEDIQGFEEVYIICEDFRLYPSKAKAQHRSNFPAVKVIGSIEQACWSFHYPPPILQSPSVKGRALILPEHREMIGSSPHRKDAYSHLRYWFMTEYRE